MHITRYGLIISAIISLCLSAFLTLSGFWGFTQKEVSDLLPTIITPTYYTFSIWSIIYISWCILGVYVYIKKIEIQKKHIYMMMSAQILSSIWLIPSQMLLIPLSFIIMISIILLLTLLFFISREEDAYFQNTVQLFYGWICIASIANLHQVLVFKDIYFFPTLLGYISIFLAFWYNIWLLYKYNSWIIALVYIWAGIWIYFWTNSTHIANLTFVTSIVLMLYMLFKNQTYIRRFIFSSKTKR